MSRTRTLPPVNSSMREQVTRDGSILPDAHRETVVWLTPSLRARARAEPRVVARYSARVMAVMCDDRTPRVKAFCALSAEADQTASCDYRRMPKKHPIRPHLFAWRTSMNRSQEWLAGELGTHHSTVLRWEKGVAGVDDQTFQRIAKAYGITVAELEGRPEDAPKARELDRLLRALPEIDEEGMRALAVLAERFRNPK